MMSGSIVIGNDSERRRFVAHIDDVEACIHYVVAQGVITFTNTHVPEVLRGRGITTQLIRVALAQARENGWRVTPLCRCVATYIKQHAETHDLLTPAGQRAIGR
jgi:predicted GNAT family acetyltransferase